MRLKPTSSISIAREGEPQGGIPINPSRFVDVFGKDREIINCSKKRKKKEKDQSPGGI